MGHVRRYFTTSARFQSGLVFLLVLACYLLSARRITAQQTDTSALPANSETAEARLQASPRRHESVKVPVEHDSIDAYIVYPQRTPAPVMLVVYDVFGMTPWAQAIADQLAAEGYVAIVPNFPHFSGDMDDQTEAEVQAQLDAAAQYAMHLPQAKPRYGIIGFCMGGGITFAHAIHAKDPQAAVVFYGINPPLDSLAHVHPPVLGLYAESDQAFVEPLPQVASVMKAHGKTFEYHVFPGSDHAFVQNQGSEADQQATREAWPLAMQWLRKYLGS